MLFSPQQLRLPVIAAPMFLVSGPALVVAACRSGVAGCFPALNLRSTAQYEHWLAQIEAGLSAGPLAGVGQVAPFGVNLIVHGSNPRLQADLAVTVKHRVPLVITSLGAVTDVVDAIHDYGGVVLHDVISAKHGEKALKAGVDGLIAVTAGAGGHGGNLNPFALVGELRRMTDKWIAMAGGIGAGGQIAAALCAGADLVSMGTRFIATAESEAPPDYKTMLVQTQAKDIVYTPKISGINANFMIPSLERHGVDLAQLGAHDTVDLAAELDHEGKAWKDLWSAGQGVGQIDDVPTTAELVSRLSTEFDQAARVLANRAGLLSA